MMSMISKIGKMETLNGSLIAPRSLEGSLTSKRYSNLSSSRIGPSTTLRMCGLMYKLISYYHQCNLDDVSWPLRGGG